MKWFAHRLRNEQAVKRIGVMQRQIGNKKGMFRPDGQLVEAVRPNLREEFLRIGIHFAKTYFDRNLPDRG
jgi:hypothetical protein